MGDAVCIGACMLQGFTQSHCFNNASSKTFAWLGLNGSVSVVHRFFLLFVEK